MAFNRHRSGPCVAIVLAHNTPACGNQQVYKWQSRGAYMAVNRHISGTYMCSDFDYIRTDVSVSV